VQKIDIPIHYVQDQPALLAICQEYAQAELLAIDTEFVRTRTLYPKLGLLQVSDGKQLALIDPVIVEDLSPFWQLLTNKNITKVLHACSEDLEVFLNCANCKPENLIDSQIMMSFLGHGLSMGYAAMVKHYTGIELDKSESRTDWTKRPLTESQLNYAAADVEYLFEIYPRILEDITRAGWLDAAKQETQLLIERKYSPVDENQLYLNVKMSWRLSPVQLNLLKHLAIWRFQQAQKRDLPLGFIAKDNTLFALAQRNPKSVGAMASLEGVELLDVRHKGKAMLAVLKQANAVKAEDFPEKIKRLDEYPGYKQIFKKVKNFISDIADETGLGAENLASKKQINQFLSAYFNINQTSSLTNGVDILTGWRLELFGSRLQEFADNDFK